MNDQEQQKLESLIHHELRRLPDVTAPRTLFHRVMLEIHDQERRPWWKRHWLQWPTLVQAVSLFFLIACAGIVSHMISSASEGILLAWCQAFWQELWRPMVPFWEVVKVLWGTAETMLQSGGQTIIVAGGLLAFICYLITVCLGTACYRMVVRRA